MQTFRVRYANHRIDLSKLLCTGNENVDNVRDIDFVSVVVSSASIPVRQLFGPWGTSSGRTALNLSASGVARAYLHIKVLAVATLHGECCTQRASAGNQCGRGWVG
jgi:hypothetical protein